MKKNNEEYEVFKIDHDEMQHQMEIEAIKSKKFIHFKTFIGAGMENPVSRMSMGNATALQMIQIMCVLKHTLEELAIQYPELYAEALQTQINTSTYKNNVDDVK